MDTSYEPVLNDITDSLRPIRCLNTSPLTRREDIPFDIFLFYFLVVVKAAFQRAPYSLPSAILLTRASQGAILDASRRGTTVSEREGVMSYLLLLGRGVLDDLHGRRQGGVRVILGLLLSSALHSRGGLGQGALLPAPL